MGKAAYEIRKISTLFTSGAEAYQGGSPSEKCKKIVNVFTDRVEEGNIAITNGIIVGIGDFEAKRSLILRECMRNARFYRRAPSSGIHAGQSAGAYFPGGTPWDDDFIVDPHEAANVSGRTA